jgi:hypothetical protein
MFHLKTMSILKLRSRPTSGQLLVMIATKRRKNFRDHFKTQHLHPRPDELQENTVSHIRQIPE